MAIESHRDGVGRSEIPSTLIPCLQQLPSDHEQIGNRGRDLELMQYLGQAAVPHRR